MATKKQRKVALLKRAKSYLEVSDPERGLCYALSRATGFNASDAEWSANMEIRKVIRANLGGFCYLQDWLRAKRMPYGKKAVYQARIQWIDWMIDCLEGRI